MAQTKDGSRIIIDTGIVTPDVEQLVRFGGMSAGAAGLAHKHKMDLPGTGIVRPDIELPKEFAGAVIIGEPAADTKIILSGSFVTATKPCIVIPSAEDVANVNNGTYRKPKLET